MKKVIPIGIFFLLLAALHVQAQNAVEDFQHINLAYQNHTRLRMEVEYKVYKNASTQEPLQVELGELLRMDGNSYHKIGKVETIATPDYQLVIDHNNKILVLANGAKAATMPGNEMAEQLSKILAYCENVQFEELNKQLGRYDLHLPAGEYSRIEVEFDRKNFLIHRMVLYYREAQELQDEEDSVAEKPRVEMHYRNINTKASIPRHRFSYAPFLSKENQEYHLKKEYQQYQFVNQLH